MVAASDANPNTTVLIPGYDPVGHQDRVALRIINIQTDATVTPNIVYGDIATAPGSGTQPVSGTVTANQGSGAAQGTSWRIKGDFTEQSALSAGSLNTDLVPSTDVSAYKSFSIQVGGTWTGTLSVQMSNDNSTFFTCYITDMQFATSGLQQNITYNSIFDGKIRFRYLRIRMTSYSSGTATGTLELYTESTGENAAGVNAFQVGTWTVQPGNTPNTVAWLVHADNDGQSTTPVAASTAANTVIKASTGRLAKILITATGTASMLIYDNATTNSGTIIGVIPANPTAGQIFDLKMPAANGITVAGNANNPGVTISWT
jgi:hypothetical protein